MFDKRSFAFLQEYLSVVSRILFCFYNPYLQQVSVFQIFRLKHFHWYPYPHMKETYSKTNRWIHFQMTSIKENAYFRHFPVVYIFGAIAHYNTFINLWILFLHHFIDSESLANTVTSMWHKFIISFTINLFRCKEAWKYSCI